MSCTRASPFAGLAGWAILLLGAVPAPAGVMFREVEQSQGPAGESRQVRQVLASAENCKVVFEEVADGSWPAGSYVLASAVDAFLVDPAERTVAPVDPTLMSPAAGTEAADDGTRITGVALDVLFEDAAGPLLGGPTRHAVYRLRYTERAPAADDVPARITRWEERHEVWVTPWPDGSSLSGWLAFRVAEDTGPGPDRQEIREALAQIHGEGLVLRHVIERLAAVGEDEPSLLERKRREVTSLARPDVAAEVFERPPGYVLNEFLAPQPAQ